MSLLHKQVSAESTKDPYVFLLDSENPSYQEPNPMNVQPKDQPSASSNPTSPLLSKSPADTESIFSKSTQGGVFKSTARKLIHGRRFLQNHGPSLDTHVPNRTPGLQAGIDVLRPPAHIADILMPVSITVTDYNSQHLSSTTLQNDTLESFLQQPRQEWSRVRWINVQGISFDVIRCLALCYKLHPLSIEDVFHRPQRIKLDMMENHAFLSMLHLMIQDPSANTTSTANSSNPSYLFRSHSLRQSLGLSDIEKQLLTRPNAILEQCNFFLLPDGIVISLFSSAGQFVSEHISPRLHDDALVSTSNLRAGSSSVAKRTLLRKSADASLLLHALLDCVVDNLFPVIDYYSKQVTLLQDLVILSPKAIYTKTLHMIGKELTLVRRCLSPMERMVHTLRANASDESIIKLSPLSQAYFGDVEDHCSNLIEEVHVMEESCKSMIDLTFNSLAHSTNESMKALALVSVVFMPITFLAGVFGMNFDYFPELHFEMGFYYFWIWVGIILFIVFLVFVKFNFLLRKH